MTLAVVLARAQHRRSPPTLELRPLAGGTTRPQFCDHFSVNDDLEYAVED